jgi:ElaB/YqjD/DUF883 family membrane-anchored ribosome-binding protein
MAQLDHTRVNGHARAALKARANDVLDDFGALRKDMRKLARAANKAARVEVQHAGARITNTASTLRDSAREKASYLRDNARERADLLSEQVRERPGAAIGISLGAGLILGMLLSPRR